MLSLSAFPAGLSRSIATKVSPYCNFGHILVDFVIGKGVEAEFDICQSSGMPLHKG